MRARIHSALRSWAVASSMVFVLALATLLAAAGIADARVHHHRHHRPAHAGTHHRHRHHRRHAVTARHLAVAPGRPVAAALAVKPPLAVVAVGADLPCANVDVLPAPENIAVVDQATSCLVNRQRRAAGLAPLRENLRLEAAAQAHSDDMVSADYFAHVTPSGVDPIARLFAVGYLQNNATWTAGENIAWGTLSLATPASIVNAWMNSPDHRANILSPDFRESGVGISPAAPDSVSGGQGGATYTQEFGAVGG